MLANILERLENDEAAGFLSEMDLSKAARTIESMETDGDGDSFRAGPQEKKATFSNAWTRPPKGARPDANSLMTAKSAAR